MRSSAKRSNSGRGGIRTHTPLTGYGILSPDATRGNPEENADLQKGAAPGAAVGAENGPIDPDLARVIEAWPKLPAAIRAGVLAMIDAADTTAAD